MNNAHPSFSSGFPAYIERGGEQSFLQPYILQGTNFYGFFLKGNLSHLQALCDRYFNAPSQGQVEYRPLSPYVLLSFDRIAHITSTEAPDRDKGFFSEQGEVIIWIPVMAGHSRGDRFVVDHLAVFIPYIFVNNSPALVSGREVYGFPKQWGWIDFPTNPNERGDFNLEAVAWETFSPESAGIRQPILSITPTSSGKGDRPWSSLTTISQDILTLLLPQGLNLPGIDLPRHLLENLLTGSFNTVFLKQFRDATDGRQACYQAIIEAPTQLQHLHDGKLLGDRFLVTLPPLASHPIAQDLGLEVDPTLPPHQFLAHLPFWLTFDFALQNGQVLWQTNQNPPPKKQKIAVLGGGLGSLTTVFELTEQPDWQRYYEITLYQMGWRLGGKGASGRNMTPHPPEQEPDYRIQEHGFHIFFGFYENAFRLMDRCYQALGDDGPFDTVSDAFKPHNYIVLEECIEGKWYPWKLDYPSNDLVPWQGGGMGSYWDYIRTALIFAYELFTHSPKLQDSPPDHSPPQNLWEQLQQELERGWETLSQLPELLGITLAEIDLTLDSSFLLLAIQALETLPKNCPLGRIEPLLLFCLDQFQARLEARLAKIAQGEDIETRRILIIINFTQTIIRGLILDNALEGEAFNDLDNIDFAQWLKKHGAWDITLNSPLVRSMYDLLFAFKGGINTPENQALGTAAALRWVIRMNLTYNGAIMWKMQAGMGDTIFAPLYQVLQERGVRFEFFHRVTNLGLEEAQPDQIATIELVRQVNLKQPEAGYEPLIRVKRLLCWPAEPLYDQIEEGEQLKAHEIDLESFWSPWPTLHSEEKITLQQGEDFDLVVLGISLGALPYICPELLAVSEKWRKMVQEIPTVTTQGGQLWFKSTLAQLGWTDASAVVGTYAEPLDTYADMTHLIPQENWSSEHYPYSLAYFTGTMPDPGIPPAEDYDFPAQQQEKINQAAMAFLEQEGAYLWPKVTPPGESDGFNWDLLVDPQAGTGKARFDAQFWRINITPTERYVMSVPGSQVYRLNPGESGFHNLFLTGDWVNNGLNSGCAEATVMAGMSAAQAILTQVRGEFPGVSMIGDRTPWQ
ncbi:NAD(P)-binding protein [Spirulina subsalsa FACHB-351]|uniref:NAD(P)-binding protein n=1 Tax=Spirulina subsalsa FACHB-351 TaxID=234711 RepID=A0ABT3L7E2_9CYAN|nr:NAD(P)-binding protein [Spirulina subsalsa]MCW6037431.1 NAD(P)-binding protein [Spirulina subsalsa FACHB-351]